MRAHTGMLGSGYIIWIVFTYFPVGLLGRSQVCGCFLAITSRLEPFGPQDHQPCPIAQ
jgi:hypothetical protein